YFRYKGGNLQCSEVFRHPDGQTCDPPSTNDADWFDVRGYPGVMTVTGADGKTSKYFTIENATSDKVWPPIPCKTYNASIIDYQTKDAIFVTGPGKLIHRIGSGNLTGYPPYVCGCVI